MVIKQLNLATLQWRLSIFRHGLIETHYKSARPLTHLTRTHMRGHLRTRTPLHEPLHECQSPTHVKIANFERCTCEEEIPAQTE